MVCCCTLWRQIIKSLTKWPTVFIGELIYLRNLKSQTYRPTWVFFNHHIGAILFRPMPYWWHVLMPLKSGQLYLLLHQHQRKHAFIIYNERIKLNKRLTNFSPLFRIWLGRLSVHTLFNKNDLKFYWGIISINV